ncbi:MAG: hypothetical protein E6R03_10710 [Hyphomicrobiaceae bacterium]|nr:MAG: hypothetical protein E6R03_10710 [Hyphomicrobiaceae bacterium]
MGNMKLPWREVAAAAAGGLFVWAWRKRAGQRVGFVVPPMEPVNVSAFQPVSLDEVQANPANETMPPDVAEMVARMQEHMRTHMQQMLSAPPAYPEPERDMAIIVHQDSNMIEIHVANIWAKQWISEQGREFGMLLEPMMPNVPFMLHVNKTISALKVADWLARGWMTNGQRNEGGNDGLASVDSPG